MVYFIFWNGKTQFFERALAVVVAIMAASFLLNFFIMMPPPIDILKGIVPSIPEFEANLHNVAILPYRVYVHVMVIGFVCHI